MAKSKTVSGHITVVQEERFRLVTDTGQGLLLTLSNHAGLDADDLCRFRDAGTRVVVRYDGEPNLESAVARSVRAA